MMLILVAALSCPKPVMLNETSFPWNKRDYQVLRQVKKRCGEIYPDAPCVKLFKKYGDGHDYSVICGAKDEQRKSSPRL